MHDSRNMKSQSKCEVLIGNASIFDEHDTFKVLILNTRISDKKH